MTPHIHKPPNSPEPPSYPCLLATQPPPQRPAPLNFKHPGLPEGVVIIPPMKQRDAALWVATLYAGTRAGLGLQVLQVPSLRCNIANGGVGERRGRGTGQERHCFTCFFVFALFFSRNALGRRLVCLPPTLINVFAGRDKHYGHALPITHTAQYPLSYQSSKSKMKSKQKSVKSEIEAATWAANTVVSARRFTHARIFSLLLYILPYACT